MTTIITDSSACISPSEADRLGVRVLPITIRTPDGDLADTPDAAARVYQALNRGEEVKTSAPGPLDYVGAIDAAEGDVLVVTPAAEFTGMHRSATSALDLAEGSASILDCRTAAAAQCLVITEAAARDGITEALAAAQDAARRAELVATVPTLEHLRKSGRVPAFAIEVARKLGVRPVFALRAGAVRRLAVPRSEEAAYARIRREWESAGGPDAARATLFHAQAPEAAAALGEHLGLDAPVVEFSPSMGIHTGPGVVGVAWLRPA